MWIGFTFNLISGLMLMMASATTLMRNPTFYVKMIFVIAGVVMIRVIDKRVFSADVADDALGQESKVLAGISLFCCWEPLPLVV